MKTEHDTNACRRKSRRFTWLGLSGAILLGCSTLALGAALWQERPVMVTLEEICIIGLSVYVAVLFIIFGFTGRVRKK